MDNENQGRGDSGETTHHDAHEIPLYNVPWIQLPIERSSRINPLVDPLRAPDDRKRASNNGCMYIFRQYRDPGHPGCRRCCFNKSKAPQIDHGPTAHGVIH